MTESESDDPPRVDVAVVTYNTRDLTVSCLQHTVAAAAGCDIRLLVHDNASADGTASAVQDAFPDARVEACDTNLGFAAGVNRLIARSDAPWLLALNSDAYPERGAIAALVAAARRHPRAAAVAPRLVRPDGSLEHSTYPFPSLTVAAVTGAGVYQRLGRERARRRWLHDVWLHDTEERVDWAIGAALLMRRTAIEEIGGFDESFFMYVEDLDWCWRAAERGWETWFTPDAVVCHVGNASGAQRYGDARADLVLHNTYDFYRRHHSPTSTAAYRLLNAAGAARAATGAAIARDRWRARFWARQLPVHLGLRHRGELR